MIVSASDKMTTDISNWREPGHNIWGFQNTDKIIRTARIQRGLEAFPLQSELSTFDKFRVESPDGLTLDLAAFLSQTETDGLVLMKDGVIIYEHYDRTNTEKSVHATFSLSKSVTGLLCGILVEQHVLDLEASVASYIEEIKGSAYENVTIRQLLDMRSGVHHDDSSPQYRSATGLYLTRPDEPPIDLHSYIASIRPSSSRHIDGLDGPPFDYVSVNADLLGWVIERVTGKRFADVLSQLIWQPMGAESDAYVTVDRSGNARTAAGLCATVRDVARLGQLILRDSPRVVPTAWVHDILHNGSEAAFAAGVDNVEYGRIFDSAAYRSYWVGDRNSQNLMASGTNGQLLLVDCKNGIVMAKTSSQPDRTDWAKIRLSVQAFRELTRLASGDSSME